MDDNIKALVKELGTSVSFSAADIPGLAAPDRPRVSSNPPPPVAEGVLAPGDAMNHVGFSWRVSDFNLNDWDIQETSSWIGRRHLVCGVRSLLQSMRNQYPSTPYASDSLDNLLQIFDEVRGDDSAWERGQVEDHIQATLNRWTENQYQLVIVRDEEREERHFAETTARRTGGSGGSWGRNLYLRLTVTDSNEYRFVRRLGRVRLERKEPMGHWESMKRKK